MSICISPNVENHLQKSEPFLVHDLVAIYKTTNLIFENWRGERPYWGPGAYAVE